MARPANQNAATEWLPLPEGMWRMEIGAPKIDWNPGRPGQWEGYKQLTFSLTLTESEQKRLVELHGEPGEGQQQSYRAWVRGKEATACGFYRSGAYEQTDCGLAQLMCAAVGARASRQVREWMANGGVPPTSDELTEEEQDAQLVGWYQWFEGLEVLATIRHDPDKKTPGKVYAHLAAILPVGSLPGQPETVYQQMCAGKVRTMLGLAGVPAKEAATEPESDPVPAAQTVAATVEATSPAADMSDEQKADLAKQYEAIFGKDKVPA